MSKLIIIIAVFFLTGSSAIESVYTFSVTSIEGVNKPLEAYQGKKLFIITLPVEQSSSNDSLLASLDSFGLAYSGSVQVIAVPSYEDGYTDAIKDSLQLWYRSKLGPGIIVTEGMYTRKSSGSLQNALFNWLTDKDRNGHFDIDVSGARDKFIIWPNGELTAVLSAKAKMNSSTLNELLQGQ